MSVPDEDDLDFEIEFLEGVIAKRPKHVDTLMVLGHDYTRRGLYEKGLAVDLELSALCPDDASVHYNLACSYALTGNRERALKALERAIELGYNDFEFMGQDDDLANVRTDPRFRMLVRLARARKEQDRAG